METLNERLTALRLKGERGRPEDVNRVMREATDRLRASGFLAGVRSVGERAPLFARPNLDGATVRLSSLLERGPVAISFFRGRW